MPGVSMNDGKGNGGQNLFRWMNYLWCKGSDTFDGNRRALQRRRREATTMYTDLLLKHRVANPGSVQFNEGDMVNPMGPGTRGMIMVWW